MTGMSAGGHEPATGELCCGGGLSVRGRTLRLMLWIATHQDRINAVASESGQLRLTWKGTSHDD